MSKSGFGQMYRRLSSKLLDLVVTPHVLGEVPTETPSSDCQPTSAEPTQKVVCYVLQNYSRSNALVVDGETRRLKLAPALDPLIVGEQKEKAAYRKDHRCRARSCDDNPYSYLRDPGIRVERSRRIS